MGSCYSSDHIPEDHIQTNITTSNTDEPQQNNRLGTVSHRILRGLELKCILLDPNPRTSLLQWFKIFGPQGGFPNPSMNQHRKQTRIRLLMNQRCGLDKNILLGGCFGLNGL